MEITLSNSDAKALFEREFRDESGVNVRRCYQCGKCSAGCPMAYEMDILPNQIVRLVQLGMEEEALKSRTIWTCASCLTCSARCPREIEIAEIMDSLRRRAAKKGLVARSESEVPLFNKIFLANVRWFGRLYEAGLIGAFNLLSGEFFKDMGLAPKMFLMRKIGPLPHAVGTIRERGRFFRTAAAFDGAAAALRIKPGLVWQNLSKVFSRLGAKKGRRPGRS